MFAATDELTTKSAPLPVSIVSCVGYCHDSAGVTDLVQAVCPPGADPRGEGVRKSRTPVASEDPPAIEVDGERDALAAAHHMTV